MSAATHDDAWELLLAVAIDSATDDETRSVLEHAAACERCRPELTRLQRETVQLLFATPAEPAHVEGAARMRERLLARARADLRGEAASRGAPSPTGATRTPAQTTGMPDRGRGTRRAAPWVLALAATVLVAISGLVVSDRQRRDVEDALARQTEAVSTMRTQAAALRRELTERDRLLDALVGSDVAAIQLTSAGAQAPRATMYWNRETDAWTFIARGLPTPAPGRAYQVWLITPDGPMSVGVVQPDASGDVEAYAEVAVDVANLRGVAVTEEPAGGVSQPTGRLVLEGSASL